MCEIWLEYQPGGKRHGQVKEVLKAFPGAEVESTMPMPSKIKKDVKKQLTDLFGEIT